MFTDSKLQQIRNGIRIKMRLIKFWAELINKQNTNTWLHLKSYDNSIIDIRHVFRKLDLRVNRLIRTGYGPFTLGNCKNPGTFEEIPVPRSLGSGINEMNKQKLNKSIEKIENTKLKLSEDIKSFEDKLINKAKTRVTTELDSNNKLEK